MTAADLRALRLQHLNAGDECAARGDLAGISAAIDVARYLSELIAEREAEEAAIDAVLAGAFPEVSGVRRAPGLEGVRARIAAIGLVAMSLLLGCEGQIRYDSDAPPDVIDKSETCRDQFTAGALGTIRCPHPNHELVARRVEFGVDIRCTCREGRP